MNSGATETAAPATVSRDARVDTLGFCNLVQHFADDLKSDIKVRMTSDGIDRVAGDFFEALLTQPVESTVDPAKLLKLFEGEKITRAQLLSALSVRKEPLKKFLSGDQIEKMSDAARGTPRLNVTRIKDVDVKLVDAVKALARAIPQ